MKRTTWHGLWTLALAAAVASMALPATATTWQFTKLVAPGVVSTDIFDVNNLGQIAGSSFDGTDSHAFVYENRSFRYLVQPAGALGSLATGLSDNGVVVGSYYVDRVTDPDTGEVFSGALRGFAQDANGTQTIEMPGAFDTQVRGVSPDGRYVSGLYNADNVFSQGFVFDRVTGQYRTVPGNSRGLQSTLMIPQGINSAGQVVGSDNLRVIPGAPSERVSFIYDLASGVRTDFTRDANVRQAFRDIDSLGRIAGWVLETDPLTGVQRNYGIVGIPGHFEELVWPGLTTDDSMALQGINDAGWVTGSVATAGGDLFGFLAVPVPEPASALLLLGGLAALAGTRRRERPLA